MTSCDLFRKWYRMYMFYLFIEKNFESKGVRKRKRKKR